MSNLQVDKSTAVGGLLFVGIGGVVAYNAYNMPAVTPKNASEILPQFEQTATAAGRQLAYQQSITTQQAGNAALVATATGQAIDNQAKQLTLAEQQLQLTKSAQEIENQRLQYEQQLQLTASVATAQANATATMQAVALTQTAVPIQTQQAIAQQRVAMQLAAEQQTLLLRTWSPWVLGSVGLVMAAVVVWRVRHSIQSYIGQFADVVIARLKLFKRAAGVDVLTVESSRGQISVASTARSVAAGMTVKPTNVQFHSSGVEQAVVTTQGQAIEFVQAGGRRKAVVSRPTLQATPVPDVDDVPLPTLIQSASNVPLTPEITITTATPDSDAYAWMAELER